MRPGGTKQQAGMSRNVSGAGDISAGHPSRGWEVRGQVRFTCGMKGSLLPGQAPWPAPSPEVSVMVKPAVPPPSQERPCCLQSCGDWWRVFCCFPRRVQPWFCMFCIPEASVRCGPQHGGMFSGGLPHHILFPPSELCSQLIRFILARR